MSDDIERCEEEEHAGESVERGREQRLEALRNRPDRLVDGADRLHVRADELENAKEAARMSERRAGQNLGDASER